MPSLQLEGIDLQRGSTLVFRDLSLSLDDARIGLIGDNGAGKTSLLRLLCGLEEPSAGQVRIDGQDIHREARGLRRSQLIGMMFQNPDDQIIFPTVEEELALSLQPQGLGKREALVRARAFLDGRGLAHWAQRAVTSLSQGQRQHVCWLALLLAGPATLLLDEPYASLDLPGQARLASDLDQCSRQLIVSTHLLQHVRHYPRVLWIDQGAVRLDGEGPQVCAAYEEHVARQVAAIRHGHTASAGDAHTAAQHALPRTTPPSAPMAADADASEAARSASGRTAPSAPRASAAAFPAPPGQQPSGD